MSHKKNTIVRSSLIAIFSLLSFTAFATWSAPGVGPTGGNTPPPVNVGSSLQAKGGSLAVTGFRSFSFGIFNGDVIIGANETPTARLDVRGKAKVANFQMTTGASADKVLASDAQGNASWVDLSSLPGGGSGEANTASNLGGGLANFDSKNGVDLRFNTFKAEDFNLSTNLLSLDYANGQKANASQPGFLSSTDWSTFNGKLSNITGLVTAGTNISITGNGTSGFPYVINATGGGVTAHGDLTGLTGTDHHTQYALLAGRNGGQTLLGGTGSGDDLILNSTSHGTKGYVLLNSAGGNVGIGTTSPASLLHIQASSGVELLRLGNTSDSVGFYTGSVVPNGTYGAQKGSLYLDSANAQAWIKTTDTGNTGWAQLVNALTPPFTTGTAGTDFNIDTTTSPGTAIFNIPSAQYPSTRGLVSALDQSFAGRKWFYNGISIGAYPGGTPTPGVIDMYEWAIDPGNNVNHIKIRAAQFMPNNYEVQLPSVAGTVGQVLKIDQVYGSGDSTVLVLKWANP